MIKQKKLITGILRDLADMFSPEYLLTNTEDIYTSFLPVIRIKKEDRDIIDRLLTEALPEVDWTDFSSTSLHDILIKKCDLDEKTADELVEIISCVYTDDIVSFWKNKKYKGLLQFVNQKLHIEWEGSTVTGKDNRKIKCSYHGDFSLFPHRESAENSDLLEMLKNDPDMTKIEVQMFFTEKICTFLDEALEHFFSTDVKFRDIEEICADDFPMDLYINMWCDDNGFELFDYDGNGKTAKV